MFVELLVDRSGVLPGVAEMVELDELTLGFDRRTYELTKLGGGVVGWEGGQLGGLLERGVSRLRRAYPVGGRRLVVSLR